MVAKSDFIMVGAFASVFRHYCLQIVLFLFRLVQKRHIYDAIFDHISQTTDFFRAVTHLFGVQIGSTCFFQLNFFSLW